MNLNPNFYKNLYIIKLLTILKNPNIIRLIADFWKKFICKYINYKFFFKFNSFKIKCKFW